MRIGLQPFTLHELDEPTVRTVERVGAVGLEGVELGAGANTDEVHEALAGHDLGVSSLSVSREALEDDELGELAEAADAFDTDHAVLMWLGDDHWASASAVEETAARLDEYADRCAERGLQLHYHNHAHEFTDLGDTTGYEAAVAATDAVEFELDLGWAGTGGADPIDLLEGMAGRVSLVHVKDMRFEAGAFATAGEGDLDLGAAVDAAEAAGVEWALYENDEPTDPIAEVGHASALLNGYTGHICR